MALEGTDQAPANRCPSDAFDGDYLAADDVVRSFTVSKASQTITFANPGSKALSVGSFTASSSADSGLTVSLASSTGSVCSMTGSTVGLLATGTCTLIASQAGNSNYNAATNVSVLSPSPRPAVVAVAVVAEHKQRQHQQRQHLPPPVPPPRQCLRGRLTPIETSTCPVARE